MTVQDINGVDSSQAKISVHNLDCSHFIIDLQMSFDFERSKSGGSKHTLLRIYLTLLIVGVIITVAVYACLCSNQDKLYSVQNDDGVCKTAQDKNIGSMGPLEQKDIEA